MNNSTSPIVGISGGSADSASARAMIAQIRSTGATPLFLGNHANRDADKDIGKIDALVVMGNDADIDPERYGQKPHQSTKPESATPTGKARADYEYRLMLNAIKAGMPLLGVCGGMQRLNVLLGGSLHQHVPDITGNNEHAQHEHNIAPFIPVQHVAIDKQSTLGAIAGDTLGVYTPHHGAGVVDENSMHHQAVDRVGNGLRAVGFSVEPDRNGNAVAITEAIEADPATFGNQFILGVQWHPEFGASPLGPKIAASVAQAASRFAAQGQRVHPPGEAQDETIFSALPQITLPQPIGSMTEMILRRRAATPLLSRA